MKRYIAILVSLAALLLSGCNSDEMPPTAGLSEPVDTVQEESGTEETSDTEEAESMENNDLEDDEDSLKGPDDFYIKVTDCNGEEKLIYYVCGDEENDTHAYMQEMKDDPEMYFGYISVLSQDLPAKTDTAFFGDELRKFAGQSKMGYATISYFYADNGFSSSSQVLDAGIDPEKFEKLMDAVCSFEPEYVPELMEEKSAGGNSPVNPTVHVYDETVNGNYDMRYPLSSINIYPGNIEHYPTLMTATVASLYSVPSINFSFSRYDGETTICRMTVRDYREIQKLTDSEKQPPSPEELEKAYYASTYYVSDWFYINDTEFYDYALKCVLLSDDSKFPGAKQKSSSDGYDPTEQQEGAKIKLAAEPSVYADSTELASADSDRGNSYIAYYSDLMTVTFYILDWDNDYDTGFECYLEKREADGLWYRVEPIGGGIIQANNGSGHFYNVLESGRKHVTFDLAAYPLLPPGNYRLVKPFWQEGSDDHNQYAAFFEFKMSVVEGYGSGITASAKCGQETYSSDVRKISFTVDVEGGSFIISDITDIERLENGEWVSVRTKPVRTNSIGGSYALRFSGMEETVDTGAFDLSKPGDYRIRISVGEYDITTDDSMFVDNYDTVYAYFEIEP